jgi:adenosylcobyric acid synthase
MGKPLQIMFLGTGSDVGKSVLAAGFCRILARRNISVAPFKAQNMALNSFVTMKGDEMGRAQVMQAHAAGIQPEADMNPVLLKPSGQATTQVIVQGKVLCTVSAVDYYRMKSDLLPAVLESYTRLQEKYDAIVIEGAGSTTEMNLKKNDFVNISLAVKINAPVVLVADIDRGGVFASVIGTMKLLSMRERRLVLGTVINKFRGDPVLFDEGVTIISRKTGRPVFGVLPYLTDLHLPEEDSVALQRGKKGIQRTGTSVSIGVVHLPYLSNYTDFDPFELEEDVALVYARDPDELAGCSVIIVPGTKNSIHDLLWLRERGFEQVLHRHAAAGKTVVGICGGYQMLGTSVHDPHRMEGSVTEARGLGLLPVQTVMDRTKTLVRAAGTCRLPGLEGAEVRGYEIHMGVTTSRNSVKPAFSVGPESKPDSALHPDGSIDSAGRVWGTYLHGLFENDGFRTRFLENEGRSPGKPLRYQEFVNSQYERLADLIEEHVDVNAVLMKAEKFR